MAERELVCDHCGADYVRSSRSRTTEYGGFCSYLCGVAVETSWQQVDGLPVRGPCPTCDRKFSSSEPRVYCSLECYVESPDHASLRAEVPQRQLPDKRVWAPQARPCLQCGTEYKPKHGTIGPLMAGMFCSQGCTRRYRALRFDRWYANPKQLVLMQGYDDFLTGTELLPCLFPGCRWRGNQLTTHMNMFHGVPTREFKRAAGFSYTTGVTSNALRAVASKVARQKHQQGRLGNAQQRAAAAGAPAPAAPAVKPQDAPARTPAPAQQAAGSAGTDKPQRVRHTVGNVQRYRSAEMRERRAKANSLRSYTLVCEECELPYVAASPRKRLCDGCKELLAAQPKPVLRTVPAAPPRPPAPPAPLVLPAAALDRIRQRRRTGRRR